MRIDFQQGIVTYPSSSNIQVFLAKVGSYVNIQTANGRVDVAFAYGTENYLLTEAADVNNAWGPLLANTNYWVYWDIDVLTAVKSYGVTTVAPQTSSIQPVGVENLHWFNIVNNTMYVYRSGTWVAVIRAFAALVNNGIFTPLGSGFSNHPFAGTQVGLNTPNTVVGRITVDDVGAPILKSDKTFFTSEDDFFVNGSPINALRPESSIFHATATQNIAKYQVVTFTHFGKIKLASYNDSQSTLTAISLVDITIYETGSLCLQGVVNNPAWMWPTVGAQLWVANDGLLTDADPHLINPITHLVPKVAVARVLSPTSIYFCQGLGGMGDVGPAATALPYDIAFYTPYNPYDINAIVSGFLSPRFVTVQSSADNIAKCSVVASTVPEVFNLNVNGITQATVTFEIGQPLGNIVFTLGDTISIETGDTLTLCTTNVLDDTIAGIGVTLVGFSNFVGSPL